MFDVEKGQANAHGEISPPLLMSVGTPRCGVQIALLSVMTGCSMFAEAISPAILPLLRVRASNSPAKLQIKDLKDYMFNAEKSHGDAHGEISPLALIRWGERLREKLQNFKSQISNLKSPRLGLPLAKNISFTKRTHFRKFVTTCLSMINENSRAAPAPKTNPLRTRF